MKRKKRDGALFPLLPFALPSHMWLPAKWESVKPDKIIHRFRDVVLVRRTNRTGTFRIGPALECAKAEPQRIALQAQDLINALFLLAEQGNQEAAFALVKLLAGSVSGLTQLGESKPALLQPVARKCWAWPMMKSRHPRLSDSDEILSKLNLGYDLPFWFDGTSKWQFDEWGTIAFHLLFYVWRARKENRHDLFNYGRIGKLADVLPCFSRATADKWWELALAIFRISYPNPEEISEFAELITLKRRTPSRVREKILARIKQRFVNFAKP
jgi:hypothetical protein